MRLVNLEQGSKEWLEFRKQGIGSSDCAAIRGQSKYMTARELWESKLGLRPDKPGSFIADVGTRMEPRARAHFAMLTDIDVEPAVAVHDEFAFLRASFDGICETSRTLVEIKMVGKDRLAWVRENRQPLPDHVAQIQQQFLVSQYERGFYVAYTVDGTYSEITDYECVQVAPVNSGP